MKHVLGIAFTLSFAFHGFAGDLAGLWKAEKKFGPDARGTLVLLRDGGNYTADFFGRIIPVKATDGQLVFGLPGEGKFRGTLNADGTISGFWLRPGTPVNGAGQTGPVCAVPVRLKADGPDRWRGNVDPSEDTFTFYLLLQSQPDGALRAVLRNPEFDLGSRDGVDRLIRDGNKLTLHGKRRGKEQQVATGTYDEENDVITLVFPSRGGSYDFMRDSDDSAFYPRGKNPIRYTYRAPLAFDDGWRVGTLDGAEIDRRTIEKFIQRILETPMDSQDAPQVQGLAIARHGKLVLEEYFHGHHRNKMQNTRSASKSLTALTVGAAIQAGVPLTPASRVYQVMNGGTFPANLDPPKRAMTLEDLLTMSAGFYCDDTDDNAPGNESTMWDQSEEPDFYRFIMKAPMATPPGENAVYCSAMPNLALGMAGRAAHEDPMSLFDRLLARPMKFGRYQWGLDHSGQPYGGGGMTLLLRDFLKLGQLMLNRGMWEGRRLVGADFIDRASSPLYNLRKIYYGYYWWGEKYPYKDRTLYAWSARGAGGQTVTVIPELDLVIGTFAANFSSNKGMFAASTEPIPRVLLPAVREPGDDRNAPVVEREYVSPYGPSKDGSRVSKKP